MRDQDGALIGLGMATAVYPTKQSPSSARVWLYPDGTVIAASATHELGIGAYTAMVQVAADALGMSLDRVRFELDDSTLPNVPIAGGSQSAASVGSAVQAAALDVQRKIFTLAVADRASPL